MRNRLSFAIAALALITAAVAAGQSTTSPVDPTVAEIRALRADINQRLEANIRVQLLVARLTLQEQRTSDVVRQLSEVTEKMRTHEQTKAQVEGMSKMFGELPKPKPGEEENFMVSMLRGQKDAAAKTEEELRLQHAELTTALSQEQARWASFNAQLAELERLFEKPRRDK